MLPFVALALALGLVSVDVPRVQLPPKLSTSKTISIFTDQPVKTAERYTTDERRDDVELVTTRTIAIWDRKDLIALHMEWMWWAFVARVDRDERATLELRFRILGDRTSLGATRPLSPERFELVFAREGEVRRISATLAAASTSELARNDERLVFPLQLDDMLAIADAGAVRIKSPEGVKQLDLDTEDAQALRWFVWEKVPGGRATIEARYRGSNSSPAAPSGLDTSRKVDGGDRQRYAFDKTTDASTGSARSRLAIFDRFAVDSVGRLDVVAMSIEAEIPPLGFASSSLRFTYACSSGPLALGEPGALNVDSVRLLVRRPGNETKIKPTAVIEHAATAVFPRSYEVVVPIAAIDIAKLSTGRTLVLLVNGVERAVTFDAGDAAAVRWFVRESFPTGEKLLTQVEK